MDNVDLIKVFTLFLFTLSHSLYLSVSVAVFALFSDPVDGVEVFIGAQTRQWVLKGVHKFTGAITIHTGSSAAVVIFINSWREGERGEGHTHYNRCQKNRAEKSYRIVSALSFCTLFTVVFGHYCVESYSFCLWL